jgi:adenylate cyclase
LAIGGLAVLSFAVFFAFGKGLWIPWVPPAMAWLMSSSIIVAHMVHQEKKQRELLMQLFSRHVSKEIANAVWEEREEFLDGGRPRPQRLMATVLFTDLIGFTSVSEKLDPQMLMRWLNEYMEAMAEQVVKHGGIINKYIGDAIMAVFGVPLARKTEAEIGKDAANALNSALAMESKLIQLNSTWKERHLPTIGMRIGVFTGPLVAGSLGSAERLEYTVIGDTVNVASRLESFDKSSFDPDLKKNTCRILIGEATYRYIEGQFNTQRVGEVNLKGQERKTTIYSVERQQE